MTQILDVPVGELFEPVGGKAKYIRDYVDAHPGGYPVYSASLAKPFGYVDEYDFDGTYLTWVMNGYGGRVQELTGRFSANRDRGVFKPREGVVVPDLTFLRFAMESQLVAAAVGRRVDGRLNEYTKIYRDAAAQVILRLPAIDGANLDYDRMREVGARLRRVEAAQGELRIAAEQLERASFPITVPEPHATLSLSDAELFGLTIGTRVVRPDLKPNGVPVYSANALVPFGFVRESNLKDFSRPSLLWGIDGNFDWNLIEAGQEFATTDHCGRLVLKNAKLDPHYAYQYLRATRRRYGFDRVFRASLGNMQAEVIITVPLDPETGEFSLDRQHDLAKELARQLAARTDTLAALSDVKAARISTDF